MWSMVRIRNVLDSLNGFFSLYRNWLYSTMDRFRQYRSWRGIILNKFTNKKKVDIVFSPKSGPSFIEQIHEQMRVTNTALLSLQTEILGGHGSNGFPSVSNGFQGLWLMNSTTQFFSESVCLKVGLQTDYEVSS